MPTPAIQRFRTWNADARALIAAEVIRADALGPDAYADELNAYADRCHIQENECGPQDAEEAAYWAKN